MSKLKDDVSPEIMPAIEKCMAITAKIPPTALMDFVGMHMMMLISIMRMTQGDEETRNWLEEAVADTFNPNEFVIDLEHFRKMH